MKKSIKFTASLIIVFIILLTFSSTYSYAGWQNIYYEETNHQFIGTGIEHEKILRFTDKGWYNINILKADLEDPYVTLDLLFNQEGINNRKKLSELANQNDNVVGAINGDFFNTQGAASLGPMLHKGEILTTPFYLPSQMAVFNMTIREQPFINYWSIPNITVKNDENGAVLYAQAINKETESTDIAVIYTPAWGEYSPPVNPKLSYAVLMSVSNGRVQSVGSAESNGNPIPADGFVIFATGNQADYIVNSFNNGDEITFDINSNINYEELSLAIGGGALIVENGSIKDVFSHEITGNHPRSALGITENNEEILLITVDGRTASFPGVTQRELAQIMLDAGAHTAINLDGGGSTDMVLKPLGQNNLQIANHLSDGRERNITNGIGIINSAPASALKGLLLETEDTNVFLDTSRAIKIRGYDKYYNPVDIDSAKVKWSVSEGVGDIHNGIFTPAQPGKAVITAEYKEVKKSIELKVLKAPTALSVSPEKIIVSPGESIQLQINGINNEGYVGPIDHELIKYQVPFDIGFINKQGLYQSSDRSGTGIIKASFGGLTAHVPVIVGSQKIIIDDFESLNGTFLSYPSVVTGNYDIVPFKMEGRFSGELSYDFTSTDATRAAYLVLDNGGITLEEKPQSIGLWVYGNEGGGHSLKIQISDSKGSSENITLSQAINWNGWKYVEAELPTALTAPVRIERIYVVEINPAIKDTGKVYLDNLTLSYPLDLSEQVPENTTTFKDLSNVESVLETEKAFRFFAYGNVTELDTLKDNLVISKMAKTINEHSSINIFAGLLDAKLSNRLKAPITKADRGYSYTEYKDSGFITLDNNNSGLRRSNLEQWPWIFDTIDRMKVNNLFITLPKPLDFYDALEEKLFKQILTELKYEQDIDVWVLHGGNNEYNVHMENGIHYVALKDYPTDNKYDIYQDLDMMIFTVNEDTVTYQIKPLYTKN